MLRDFELRVLAELCRATKTSKAAHVSEHAFVKKFPNEKHARKALRKLITAGYVAMHPTRGEMTYQMTKAGWDICREIKGSAPR